MTYEIHDITIGALPHGSFATRAEAVQAAIALDDEGEHDCEVLVLDDARRVVGCCYGERPWGVWG